MKMTKFVFTLLAAVAFAVGSAGLSQAANLLTNGELDVVGGAVITGWSSIQTKTFSGPTSDLITLEPWMEIAPITNGGGDFDQGGFAKAFQGNNTTGDLATLHFYQDAAGSAGTTYVLSAMIGAGPNYSGILGNVTKTLLAIDFDNDNDPGNGVLGSSTLDVKAAGLATGGCCTFGALPFSVSGTSPAGTTVVRARFSMVDGYSTSGGDQAAFIDDFSLEAVPEPASVALGLFGLSLLGLVRRRG